METNYFINIYEQKADNTWELLETVETRHGYIGVINGHIHHMCDGRICGECSMTQEEAEEKHRGRYFQIAKSEPITDYVIDTFDICRFSVEKKYFKSRYVIRVQLVNTRKPYYFVQQDGENWKHCRTICHGEDMQEVRAGMDMNFKGGEYVFEDVQEREKFESLF